MDTIEEARRLAALAGIHLPAEREAALGAGLQGMRRIAQMLAARDYSDMEPAAQFRAPARPRA